MRITVGQLRRIIKEEVSRLREANEIGAPMGPEDLGEWDGEERVTFENGGKHVWVWDASKGLWLEKGQPGHSPRRSQGGGSEPYGYSSHGGDAHFDRINRRDDGRFDPRYTGY